MEEKIQKIDPYILKLLDFDGFCSIFWQYCKEYSTQEKAYEATERVYKSHFGKTKYANFESFRECKNRMLRNK
jgi:hypothetical protein